eukprot:scaffold57370_cov39-Phaeocystis_antarctica.AAC.1
MSAASERATFSMIAPAPSRLRNQLTNTMAAEGATARMAESRRRRLLAESPSKRLLATSMSTTCASDGTKPLVQCVK